MYKETEKTMFWNFDFFLKIVRKNALCGMEMNRIYFCYGMYLKLKFSNINKFDMFFSFLGFIFPILLISSCDLLVPFI